MKLCPYCVKEIEAGEDYFSLAIEIPYVNLLFHRGCFKAIEDIKEFVEQEHITKGIYDIRNRRHPLWT